MEEIGISATLIRPHKGYRNIELIRNKSVNFVRRPSVRFLMFMK